MSAHGYARHERGAVCFSGEPIACVGVPSATMARLACHRAGGPQHGAGASGTDLTPFDQDLRPTVEAWRGDSRNSYLRRVLHFRVNGRAAPRTPVRVRQSHY